MTKTSDANTVLVAEEVQAKLDEIAARHPGVIVVTTVSDLSDFIKESTDGLIREGGLGALFAVSRSSCPVQRALDAGRERSRSAVDPDCPGDHAAHRDQPEHHDPGRPGGRRRTVVDDAIVVLENIYRHRSLGEDRWTAVHNGPREVAGAITASTLTTVAVFLPLGFVGGFVSQFFLPFALTVTFALLASLVCALTVVPVLAYFLIDKVHVKVDENGEPVKSRWVRLYMPLITFTLRSKWTALGVVAFAGILFFASLSLVSQLPTQFINAGSEKLLQVSVAPPSGASSEAVLERAIEAETILDADEDVELIQTSIPGEGDTSFQTIIAAQSGRPANSATMTVRLKPTVDLAEKTAEFSTALEPIKTDGYDVQVSEAAGFTSNGLNIIVSAEDPSRWRPRQLPSWPRSKTTRRSPTSRATWSRRRPRSRSRSTRPRPSPSG